MKKIITKLVLFVGCVFTLISMCEVRAARLTPQLNIVANDPSYGGSGCLSYGYVDTGYDEQIIIDGYPWKELDVYVSCTSSWVKTSDLDKYALVDSETKSYYMLDSSRDSMMYCLLIEGYRNFKIGDAEEFKRQMALNRTIIENTNVDVFEFNFTSKVYLANNSYEAVTIQASVSKDADAILLLNTTNSAITYYDYAQYNDGVWTSPYIVSCGGMGIEGENSAKPVISKTDNDALEDVQNNISNKIWGSVSGTVNFVEIRTTYEDCKLRYSSTQDLPNISNCVILY